jgi:hypothetical protein
LVIKIKDINKMSGNLTNLGFSAQTKDLYVENIYTTPSGGGVSIQLPTNFVNSTLEKIVFDVSGNLSTLGNTKFFSGSDLSSVYTSTSRYTIGLNATNGFEIFDNVANSYRLKIDSATGEVFIDPSLFSFTLYAYIELVTDGYVLIKDPNPVADFKINVISGNLIFAPLPKIFPLTTGLVFFNYEGIVGIQGTSSSYRIFDRSTVDIWDIFSDAGLLSFYNGATVFEITSSGIQNLKGTSAGLRLYNRSATPTVYFEWFTDTAGTALKLTLNGIVIGTIDSTGITSIIPNFVKTTTPPSGTYYPALLVSSVGLTGDTLQVSSLFSFDTGTGTINATIFSGSLTGSATLIDTTAVSTNATYYIPFVPLATSAPSGQVLGTDAGISYNPSTNALTTTEFIGSLTGSATLIDTTAVSTNATYYLPFVPLATSAPSGQVLGTDAGISYNPSTNALTTTEFIGSLTGSATLIDTTAVSTNATYYLPFVPLATSAPSGQVLGTNTGITFNPSSGLLSLSGQLTLEGTSAEVLFNSQTAGSSDYWEQYSAGATNASILYIDYFNGTTTINPFLLNKNGDIGLGTPASSAVNIKLYGTGTSSISHDDADKGKIEFLMSNLVRITAGGSSAGTASLNNAGDFTVSDTVVVQRLRMNGSVNRQGFAYVSSSTNLVAQNVASAGSGFGSGNHAYLAVGGTTWTASSDRRLKYDIKPFDSCLDKVLALNPVTYKWIDTGTPALGFIAQEMQQIIPELVVVPENPENMMGIDLTNMTSFLVKAIQEQHLLILDLQNKINMLLNGR